MTDDITINVATEDDWDMIASVLAAAFNEGPDEAVLRRQVERLVFEPQRSLVARRDGEIVGTAGILTRRLCVPGGDAPTGHVTLISVVPTARRRGILTRFIRQQFADMQAAGEPLAVLWASEGRIYQRFGYGMAVRKLSLTIDTAQVSLWGGQPTGRLRECPPADLRDSLVKVYEQVYPRRPGWSERGARHWDYRLSDPPSWRRGATAMRAVTHEGDHGIDGYTLWRATSGWGDQGPAGEVKVLEQVAITPDAYRALWQFLLTVDLTRTTSIWTCAVDEPLQFLVNEPRRLGARLTDALWVRIVDLPAALMARRYAVSVDLVIEVGDALLPSNAGRWRLTGSPETATCMPTLDPPDLAFDIQTLGAIYLGGVRLGDLAAGGLVTERRAGAVAEADAAFGWHRCPSTIEVF